MLRALPVGIGALFLIGCASTHYSASVDPGPVTTGRGGTLSRYGNMDVWQNGTPDHPYRVIGTVQDNRDTSRATPSPEMQADILHALTEAACPGKADALIIVSQYHVVEERKVYRWSSYPGQ